MRLMIMHKHDPQTEAGVLPPPELIARMGEYIGEHAQRGTFLGGEGLGLTVRSRDEGIGWAERYGKVLGDGELELAALTEPWDLGFGSKPDDAPLRLLLIEKVDADTEAGTRSAKKKAELTRLQTEMTKAGVLASAERLQPSAKAKRLMFTSNVLRVLDGPFAESKELIGGFSLMQLPSIEVAIEECRRYAEILGGTLEIDVRPLEEPEPRA